MGMFFGDISIRVTDEKGAEHIEDYEKIIEKYSPIEKKYYCSGSYYSLNGESIFCETWLDMTYMPGLLEGRKPKYDNEIIITEQVAEALDLKMGDEVTVSGRSKEAKFMITGLYQTGNDTGYAFSMLYDGAKRIGAKYVYNYDMVLTDTSRLDDIAKELNDEYGSIIAASAYKYEEDIYNDTLMVGASAMKIMIYAFSGIFALVAVIMVCSKAFMQERTDLGIYKAVGFTSWRLRRQFAVRFLIISLIGSVFGALAGAFFSGDVLNVIFGLFGISNVTLNNSPLTFITAAAFVCMSTALFAFLTSRRIKRIEVRELITE